MIILTSAIMQGERLSEPHKVYLTPGTVGFNKHELRSRTPGFTMEKRVRSRIPAEQLPNVACGHSSLPLAHGESCRPSS